MRSGPGLVAGEDPSMAQQKRLRVLALLAQVLHGRCARAHRLSHGLSAWIRHPDGGQLPGPMQPGQGQGIAAVGLDALARALGDQRRGYAPALLSQSPDLPRQAIAGRAGLVAEQQLAMLATEPTDE